MFSTDCFQRVFGRHALAETDITHHEETYKTRGAGLGRGRWSELHVTTGAVAGAAINNHSERVSHQ